MDAFGAVIVLVYHESIYRAIISALVLSHRGADCSNWPVHIITVRRTSLHSQRQQTKAHYYVKQYK